MSKCCWVVVDTQKMMGICQGLQQGIYHIIFLATCLKSLQYMGFLQVLFQEVSGNFDCLLLVQMPVLMLAQRFAVIPADGHISLVFQDGSYWGGAAARHDARICCWAA